MRLQRLTGLEQDKIVGEYKEVMAQIADLLDILAHAGARHDDHRRRADRAEARVRRRPSWRAPQHDRAQRARPRHRRPDHAARHGRDAVAHRLHEERSRSPNTARRSAAGAASRRRRPRKTTGSTSSSSPTRTTTSCASPTAAACTGSRCGKCRRARATRAASRSSTCSRCSDGEKINVVLPLTGEIPQLPGRPLRVHGDRAWAPSRRRRSTSSATRARPASSPSTSTRATS